MKQKHILIVEDEEGIAEVLVAYCEKSGFTTFHNNTGKDVIDYVQDHDVDLILLDLMLPEGDGITICKEIRKFSEVPIIITTAKVEEIDRLLGLEIGADDYVCKPYSPREVIARIKTVLRRTHTNTSSLIEAAGFSLNSDTHVATLKGTSIDLTPREFSLLSLFLNHPGFVFSRQQIIDKIYSDNEEVNDRNIDTHIKNMRKKIEALSPETSPIQSVYGVGYKFDA